MQAAPRGKRGKLASVPRLDAMNIRGLTSLMNPQNIDLHKKGTLVENEITGRMTAYSEVPASQEDPRDEVKAMLAELGLDDDDEDDLEDLGGESGGSGAAAPPSSSAPPAPPRVVGGQSFAFEVTDLDAETERGARPGRGGRGALQPGDDPGHGRASTDSSASASASGSSSSDDSDSDGGTSVVDSVISSRSSRSSRSRRSRRSHRSHRSHQARHDRRPDTRETAQTSRILEDLEQRFGIDLSEKSFERSRMVVMPPRPEPRPEPRPPREAPRGGGARPSSDPDEHIESVLGALREETQTSYGLRREEELDLKASKLEHIAQLRESLEEDGINTEAVGSPSTASSMEEIDAVLRTLRMKNDRNRCATMAEEIILGMAEAIECVFDGTQEVPLLGLKPDYSGYHNTVSVKLARMRPDTSRVVSDIIERNDLGPWSRIALELGPSFLLYPRQQRHQRGTPGLYEETSGAERRVGDARQAYTSIRSRDEAPSTMGRPDPPPY